jgi:hypothetical protein
MLLERRNLAALSLSLRPRVTWINSTLCARHWPCVILWRSVELTGEDATKFDARNVTGDTDNELDVLDLMS